MNIKKINKNLSEFGTLEKISKHKYKYIDFDTEEEVYFNYKGTLADLEKILSNKNPLETLENKVHFQKITNELKPINEVTESEEEFSFAKEITDSPDKIVKLFNATSEFLDMVISGVSNAAVISGMSQIGKSTFVIDKLEEARKNNKLTSDVVLLKGATSPMALYDFIYANLDKIIVIDDCDSVFDNEKGLNVLKAVLDPAKIRKVCWLSGEAAVKEFIFTGRIIFISNYSFFKMRKNKNYKHMIAVINRSDYIEIDGDSNQVFQYIKYIEKHLYENADIRKIILQYLEEIVQNFKLRITPQLFKDLCRIREFKGSKFENLAKIKLMALMLSSN